MSIVKGYSTVVYTSGSVDSSYMWHWFQIPFHLVPFHWANEVSCVCRDWTGSKVCPEYSPLILEKLGTDSWKKVAVLLDFVQITSTTLPPPPPNLDNLYHFFERQCAKKFGQGSPLPPHTQIDPIYTVCEKWTKNLGRALPLPPPPPNLDNLYPFF